MCDAHHLVATTTTATTTTTTTIIHMAKVSVSIIKKPTQLNRSAIESTKQKQQ